MATLEAILQAFTQMLAAQQAETIEMVGGLQRVPRNNAMLSGQRNS